MRSVRDSLGHGKPNRYKNAAFAVVKDVIERGRVLHRAKDGDEDSFYISAPVGIDGMSNIVTVLVHRVPRTQRMYLHSVTTKENLSNPRVSRVQKINSEGSGSTESEAISSVLHGLLNFNPDSVSKVVDGNGEPLVVYHGTRQTGGIDEFQTPAYFATDASIADTFSGLTHLGRLLSAEAAKGKPLPKSKINQYYGGGKFGGTHPVFLSIQNPRQLDGQRIK